MNAVALFLVGLIIFMLVATLQSSLRTAPAGGAVAEQSLDQVDRFNGYAPGTLELAPGMAIMHPVVARRLSQRTSDEIVGLQDENRTWQIKLRTRAAALVNSKLAKQISPEEYALNRLRQRARIGSPFSSAPRLEI